MGLDLTVGVLTAALFKTVYYCILYYNSKIFPCERFSQATIHSAILSTSSPQIKPQHVWIRGEKQERYIKREEEKQVFTGEQGERGRELSNSSLTFDLLVCIGFTVLLTAESPLGFCWGEMERSCRTV